MQAEEFRKDHPNATFALSAAPFATLLSWGAYKVGIVMPQYVATACGTVLVGVMLIFRSAITRAADAVWQNGIVGCCRRIIKGPPPSSP